MEQHVDQVVAPGLHPAQRVVEGPRQPCHRDVVAEQGAGEGRADSLPGRASAKARVVLEVDVVVPAEEGSGNGRQEAGKCQQEHEGGGPPVSRSGGRRHCFQSHTRGPREPSGNGAERGRRLPE